MRILIAEDDFASRKVILKFLSVYGECDVTVYSSEDSWYGVTYKEDKPFVVQSIAALKEKGVYPTKLNG